MPKFLVDWNMWWLEFWTDNPVLFWGAVVLAIGSAVLSSHLSKPRR